MDHTGLIGPTIAVPVSSMNRCMIGDQFFVGATAVVLPLDSLSIGLYDCDQKFSAAGAKCHKHRAHFFKENSKIICNHFCLVKHPMNSQAVPWFQPHICLFFLKPILIMCIVSESYVIHSSGRRFQAKVTRSSGFPAEPPLHLLVCFSVLCSRHKPATVSSSSSSVLSEGFDAQVEGCHQGDYLWLKKPRPYQCLPPCCQKATAVFWLWSLTGFECFLIGACHAFLYF